MEVRILGPLQVVLDSGQVVELGDRQGRLLTRLSLADGPVPFADLAAALTDAGAVPLSRRCPRSAPVGARPARWIPARPCRRRRGGPRPRTRRARRPRLRERGRRRPDLGRRGRPEHGPLAARVGAGPMAWPGVRRSADPGRDHRRRTPRRPADHGRADPRPAVVAARRRRLGRPGRHPPPDGRRRLDRPVGAGAGEHARRPRAPRRPHHGHRRDPRRTLPQAPRRGRQHVLGLRVGGRRRPRRRCDPRRHAGHPVARRCGHEGPHVGLLGTGDRARRRLLRADRQPRGPPAQHGARWQRPRRRLDRRPGPRRAGAAAVARARRAPAPARHPRAGGGLRARRRSGGGRAQPDRGCGRRRAHRAGAPGRSPLGPAAGRAAHVGHELLGTPGRAGGPAGNVPRRPAGASAAWCSSAATLASARRG